VETHHDWTLEQHAEALVETTGVKIKKSSVGNYLKRLGISYKKRALLPQSGMKGSERDT
jgi:transposase